MTQEKALKRKEIRRKFDLSKIYLESSRNSLKCGDVRLATDAAYNAAELAMKAAILLKKDTIPKRYGGVAQLFSLLCIKDGPLDKELGSTIGRGLELRNKARYDEEVRITKKHALHNMDLAQKLITSLKNQLD